VSVCVFVFDPVSRVGRACSAISDRMSRDHGAMRCGGSEVLPVNVTVETCHSGDPFEVKGQGS